MTKSKELPTVYGVLRLDDKLRIYGEIVPLPNGQFLLPVFADRKVAEEYSQNGKFQIIELGRRMAE